MTKGVYIRTEETKKKQSDSSKGHKVSPETRQKIRLARLGTHIPEETKQKMRQAALGKVRSPETREKLRLARLGKSLSEQTKEKIRRVFLGRKASPETLERMRLANIGKKHTEGTKRKMSELLKKAYANHTRIPSKAMLGKHPSKETILRMKEAQKLSWQKNPKRAMFGKFADVMSGKNNPFYGKKHSEESIKKMSLAYKNMSNEKREKIRQKMRKHRATQIFPLKDSSIEVKLQNALTQKGIKFEKHKTIGNHQADFFIKPNIVVETDGNFWHANPQRYAETAVMYHGKTAKQVREHDTNVTKMLWGKGYFVMRFWETAINKNLENVVMKIENAIGEIV